ncbi:MAG TPA: GH92 family glycosyl hydrolase [Saprospiraceae bacterium]|nr:GH92 family glycosyl hydrolase [Saprospiraceae bacterium]HMQ82676.1 GH92 family glycosyl hydrolase [Saprospiraceae bacterium]
MNKIGLFVLASLFAISSKCQPPVDWVNPFIGTSNYGATHPGAVLPAGMASVVPFNVAYKKGAENVYEKDSEWHSRTYVHENRFLTGFAHVNLSGVGCPELGSILLMPTTGELEFDASQYGSTYQNETASPGYYQLELEKYGIACEMSATLRSGVSRYRFPAGQANVLLNLGLGLTNETGAQLRVVSAQEVEGFKMIGTFCYNPEDVRPVYFVARLSKPAQRYGAWKKMPKYGDVEGAWTKYNDKYKPYEGYTRELAGEDIGAWFSYDLEEAGYIEVKVGISYTSIENARKNLDAEQPGFDFEQTVENARSIWNEKLSRIAVKGGSQEDKIIFYSALYHTLLHPNILQDVNGDYPAMEGNAILNANGKNRYTVFSLWDTYRNVHPFLSLVYPELQLDMVHSMLDMYRESGWLPKWELLGMETAVMVGDPATPVLADTYLRGLKQFDLELAYEAARKAAMTMENNPLRPGNLYYDSLGYIPENSLAKVWGTVSTTLEYNISDWNLAQMAKILGKTSDYDYFLRRSQSYRQYFDPETKMLRPLMENGQWLTPFNPEAGKNFEPVIGFVEGNAWQYRFYVPHDIPGMIQLIGGEEAFYQALMACFETNNYDMANEPDITYPYLFNYVPRKAYKTQETVRRLIRQYYYNGPAGLPGNDDTGTLSVWLLFSMMGLYPDCPGNTQYALTSPVFDEVSIQLDTRFYPGKELSITSRNNQGDKTPYIQKVSWNGQALRSFFIDHHQLVKGGELLFDLKDTH